MYFPYLRGRQYELIALRELADLNLIGNKIMPIIEPVSPSSTLISTVNKLVSKRLKFGIIANPKVGTFGKKEEKYLSECIESIFKSTPFFIVDDTVKDFFKYVGKPISECGFIFTRKDYIKEYSNLIEEASEIPMFTLMPDEGFYRRSIHFNRVLLHDSFEAQPRNSDYSDNAELFSEDHLYFQDDGYVGFSDYLTIGEKYNEGGFLPYCVVIHITYLDEQNRVFIKHFKSDSNDDTNDPAGKFYEALSKFVEWNKENRLNTYAARELERLYQEGLYPGLGTVKKLSLMNHIELMNKFLNNEN